MTNIRFYELRAVPVEKALPRLLEKIVATGRKIVLLCASEERMKQLDMACWTFSKKSFLPHATHKDPWIEKQLLLLTTVPENPISANVLVLDQGVQLPASLQEMDVIDMFDGSNIEMLQAAKLRRAEYEAASHSITWWQQDAEGKWIQP